VPVTITTKLKLLPGVDLQSTPTLNQTQWAQTQLVRFYKGLIQKLGGWAVLNSGAALIGTCRALVSWADLLGNIYVAAGTEQRLQIAIGATALTDITPVQATSNIAVSFSTNTGFQKVVIADTYVPAVGDWINLITQVSVGGLVLSGFYQVAIVGSGNYTILAGPPATSTVTNGGAVPTFATTGVGSPTVQVVLANHGLTATTSSFNVPISVTVGGVTLLGPYVVQSVVSSSTFTINAAISATSVAGPVGLNGGNAQIEYLLPTGETTNTAVGGYGIGLYGVGLYGVTSTATIVVPMRIWSLDHYGQDLIAAPNGGTIYYWTPGQTGPASVVTSTPPLYVNWILSVPQVQMVMALGAESGGTQYPLLLRWCDVGGLFETNGWVPTATNQAGSFQLNSGSKLVFGAANGLTIYVWTDLGVWSATYQGLPFVFSVQEIARECGAISSRAVAVTSQGAIWLSRQGFYQLTGGNVSPIECPVWDWYYNHVDTTQLDAIFTGLNSAFHEVFWFFPVTGGNIFYVKWNWAENVWDYGILTRYAWIDASPWAYPLAVGAAGLIMQHELGTDANGQPMVSYAQTGFFDVHDGEDFIFVDQLIPDFTTTTGATMELTLLAQSYPEGATRTDGPYSVQFGGSGNLPSNFVTTNTRGRQIALQIQSMDAGSSWRLGALRYRWKLDGKV
jgi:hypothetical protein